MQPISAHLLVPPHAFKTLAIFATGGGFVPDYTYSVIKFDNQAADQVNIICGGVLIDQFAYSTADATSYAGQSFSVDPSHYNAAENDTPGNFCAGMTVYNQNGAVRDYGSPGADNPPCP
jgi:hypothetical protein